jgi:hypothetical protein
MARVAHATSETRNRNNIALIGQPRTLDKKVPFALGVSSAESALAHELI